MSSQPAAGHVVTFYSYKGGVGRTMALANVAYLLALAGKRVLAIDFDLEAPGLDRYFRQCSSCTLLVENTGGLIDVLEDLRGEYIPGRWKRYLSTLAVRDSGVPLQLLPSGSGVPDYGTRVLDFDWRRYYADHDGANVIERLRDEWRGAFDVVLIDSRTGITDSAGVCTIQLPDTLVLLFTANEQSLMGAKAAALGAQQARSRLENVERPPLRIIPMPARWAGRTEVEQARKWMERFTEEFAELYRDWLPAEYEPKNALDRVKIPHVGYYSFGERIASAEEANLTDPDGLPFAYAGVAKLIGDNFEDLRGFFPLNPLVSAISDVLESHFVNAYADRPVEQPSVGSERPPARAHFSSSTLRRVREVVDRKIQSGEVAYLKGKSLLWVHNDATHDQFEKQIFEELGASVTFALTTREAIERVQSRAFDVVLSNMRRENDFEAGFTLREKLLQAGVSVPFVLYTRTAMESRFRHKAVSLGITEYTNSPIELFEMVLEVLRPKQPQPA